MLIHRFITAEAIAPDEPSKHSLPASRFLGCEPAPKRDPTQSGDNSLTSLANPVRGGVPIGADRAPPSVSLSSECNAFD